MKKLFLVGLMPVLLAACAGQPSADNPENNDTVTVATSFYPLTHIAEQVGGDSVNVYQISAQGADPHTYEPTPQQMQRIREADLLVYNGRGQDPWADRIRDELETDGMRVLMATEIVELISYEEEHEHERDDDHDEDMKHDDAHEEEEHDARDNEDEDDHGHDEWDPHVWLDPLLVMQITDAVAEELSRIDLENSATYAANAARFIAELEQLHEDMQAGLSDCTLASVIVSHDAFRYLAHRYGFATLEIAGLSPSAEPSPARLAELARIARERGIEHVFFETQVSPALSRTLADEIGADTLVLHSIETRTTEERSVGMAYADLMRRNLENLRTAMQCT